MTTHMDKIYAEAEREFQPIGLPSGVARKLARGGITSVSQLRSTPWLEVCIMPGLGNASLRAIERALETFPSVPPPAPSIAPILNAGRSPRVMLINTGQLAFFVEQFLILQRGLMDSDGKTIMPRNTPGADAAVAKALALAFLGLTQGTVVVETELVAWHNRRQEQKIADVDARR